MNGLRSRPSTNLNMKGLYICTEVSMATFDVAVINETES